MFIKKMLTVVGLFLCCGISKGEAALINGGTYSAGGGSLMMPFENKATGVVKLSNTTALSLINYGDAQFTGCLFIKTVSNQGILVAENTKFQDVFSISGGKTILNSCELSHIQINDQDATPFIQLNGDTHVLGSIVFQTGRGKLIIGPAVRIDGDVVGGEFVIKESE